MSTTTTVQLGLFNSPLEFPIPQPAAKTKTLTREELWLLFKAEYESARFLTTNIIQVNFPNIQAVTIMARMQVQRFNSSQRSRQDADLISLLGKLGWSFYLGESAKTVFDAWEAAVGVGNKGVFWSWPGESVGLRTTSGNKSRFSINRNRHSDRITAYAFARIQTQHNGSAFVELIGAAQRHRMYPFIRNQGHYLTVESSTLSREGLIIPASDFKALYEQNKGGKA